MLFFLLFGKIVYKKFFFFLKFIIRELNLMKFFILLRMMDEYDWRGLVKCRFLDRR